MSASLLVFLILAVTIALFVSDKLRLDVIALMALLALVLTKAVTTQEALAGFSESIVITITALFIVSGGLFQTGVAEDLGALLSRKAGTSEPRLLLFVMVATAGLAAFMGSTGTVAVMLPITVSLAWKAGISPSRFLIPMAFGSLLGGKLTLIGTPPNIVVSEYLESIGEEPFSFFAITPIGATLLVAGVIYMLVLGRKMLPSHAPAVPYEAGKSGISVRDLASQFAIEGQLHRLRILKGSALEGQTLALAALRTRFDVTVLAIVPARDLKDPDHLERATSRPVVPETVLEAGDLLLVQATEAHLAEMEALGLERLPVTAEDQALLTADQGMVEIILPTRSRLLGKTLREWQFRDRYRVTAVALRRGTDLYTEHIGDMPLRYGDSLLVKGPWQRIKLLRDEWREFVVVAMPREGELTSRRRSKAPVALGIMGVMLVLMTFSIVPTVIAVLLAAVAMVLTGCITMEEGYRSINWQSVVLIAAMLPMSTALEKSGGMGQIVSLITVLGQWGPLALMAGIFILTSGLSQVMSNTATSVLIAPIAFQSAVALGVSPYPFMMTVGVAASMAFATPVASPVNTLVLGPGQYTFMDFVKVGSLMQVIAFIVCMLLIPYLFPF